MNLSLKNEASLKAPSKAGARSNNSIRKFFRQWENVLGTAIVIAVVLIGLLSHWLEPYSPIATNFNATLQAPSIHHWFGTDALGRDVFSRIVAGTNASLSASVGAVAIALIVGSFFGLIAGYWSGTLLDETIMRIMDAILVLPPLVLALAIAFILGDGIVNAMIAIAIVFTPQFARIVRAKTLTVRTLTYIEAAHAQGGSTARVLFVHVLPPVLQPAFVLATLNVGRAVIVEASLAYLGLGLEPPTPNWGFMISSNVNYLSQAPWLVFAPSLTIALSVLGITLVGQGLQQLSPDF